MSSHTHLSHFNHLRNFDLNGHPITESGMLSFPTRTVRLVPESRLYLTSPPKLHYPGVVLINGSDLERIRAIRGSERFVRSRRIFDQIKFQAQAGRDPQLQAY